jgi:threonine/homoserine/homoserine lactone efflux protein
VLIHLLQGVTYGFAAAVQPGPLSTYLVSEALRTGWRRTLPAIFAPILSDGPIAFLMLLLLSQSPTRLLQLLSLPGGIYVLYLAFGVWTTWRASDYGADAVIPAGRSVIKAALINLLNPNPYLGWSLVLGPLLLKGWREAPVHGVAFVSAFYLTMLAGLGGLVFLFAGARSLGERIRGGLVGLSALALAAFGLYLLVKGVLVLWQA